MLPAMRSLTRCMLLWVLPPLIMARCSPAHHNGNMESSVYDLDALAAEYAEVIESLPNCPDAQKMVDVFFKAAEPQARASGLSTKEFLMYRFGANNLGLYLFEQECSDLEKTSNNVALFCARVEEKLPSTPLSRAALNRGLRLLARTDEPSFMQRVEQLISAGQQSPEARVALFTRGEHFRDSGRHKQAAVDFIRFWAWFPEEVKKMDAADTIRATLRRAGLSFEDAVLSCRDDHGIVAQSLLEEFVRAGETDFVAVRSTPPTLTSLYLDLCPDADRLRIAADEFLAREQAMPLERCLLSLRLGALYAGNLNLPGVCNAYKALCSSVDGILDQTQNPDGLVYMAEGCRTALQNLVRFDHYANSDPSLLQHAKSMGYKNLLLSVSDKYLALAQLAAGAQGQESYERLKTAIDEYVDIALKVNDRNRPIKAYRLFVDTFPNSPASPEILLALGDLLNSKLQLPSQACAVYQEVSEKYPDSFQSIVAMNKASVILYENGQYEKAYEICQLVIAEHSNTPQGDYACLTSAFCEAAMDLGDLAQQHLLEFCKARPQSPLVPKAMLWLGTQMLNQQKMDSAKNYFEDLLARYPTAEESRTAKDFVERLSNVERAGSGI